MFEIVIPPSDVDEFVCKLVGLLASAKITEDLFLSPDADPLLASSSNHLLPCSEACMESHDFVARRIVSKVIGVLQTAYIDQIAERSQVRMAGHESVIQ